MISQYWKHFWENAKKARRKLRSDPNFNLQPTTYNDPKVAKELLQKYRIQLDEIYATKEISESVIRNVIPILAGTNSVVLDIGGEIGTSYHASKIISSDLIAKYAVVENHSFYELVKYENSNTLSFFSNIEEAFKWLDYEIDILLCNSTLQYIADVNSIVEMVNKYRPRIIFFSKTPLMSTNVSVRDKQRTLLSQNGPVQGLVTTGIDMELINHVELYSKFTFEKFWQSYDLVFKQKCTERFYVEGRPPLETYSYLFRNTKS